MQMDVLGTSCWRKIHTPSTSKYFYAYTTAVVWAQDLNLPKSYFSHHFSCCISRGTWNTTLGLLMSAVVRPFCESSSWQLVSLVSVRPGFENFIRWSKIVPRAQIFAYCTYSVVKHQPVLGKPYLWAIGNISLRRKTWKRRTQALCELSYQLREITREGSRSKDGLFLIAESLVPTSRELQPLELCVVALCRHLAGNPCAELYLLSLQ